MKRSFILVLLLLFFKSAFSQEEPLSTVVDSLYREDQFYIGVTYNILGNKPEGLSQSGLSSGIHFGFIRDMPINENRNLAIGIGLGYSINSYNNNLLIEKNGNNNFSYSILDSNMNFSKNKFITQELELPIEFRWRSSTPTSYNFWRFYAGVKIGYLILDKYKFSGDSGAFNINNLEDFNRLKYGLTASFGYNTWNIYLYYGLNNVFKDSATINGNPIDINILKVGLTFYIL